MNSIGSLAKSLSLHPLVALAFFAANAMLFSTPVDSFGWSISIVVGGALAVMTFLLQRGSEDNLQMTIGKALFVWILFQTYALVKEMGSWRGCPSKPPLVNFLASKPSLPTIRADWEQCV